jgi:hypothetical protein
MRLLQFHLVFQSEHSGNHLLYKNSSDGIHWNPLQRIGEESTKTSPAIAVANNKLVIVFISNDSSNRILYCVHRSGKYDAGSEWEPSRETGELGRGVTAVGLGNKLFIYFLCNDSRNLLLGTTIIP